MIDSMTSMHCYFCDQMSPEGSLFCKPCGSPFHLAPCPRCAAVNDLKVVSCYKCKAILPIRRAETAAGIDDVAKGDPVVGQVAKPIATETSPTAHAPEIVATTEPAEHAPALVEAAASVDAPATLEADKPVQQPRVELRRPLEKVHDERDETTVALQHDLNYQKTIALQRAAAEVREEPYIQTISLHHPPASLVGGAVPASALLQASVAESSSAPPPLPIDLVQKAKWGQRALIASFALLVIVAGAYFSLRAERTVAPPIALEAEAMETLPAASPMKALERFSLPPLSPSSSGASVVGATQAVGKAPLKVDAPTKPVVPASASTSPRAATVNAAIKPLAPANQQAAKAAPNNRVLMMPPDAEKLSAAATAAAIAAALGKPPPPQPATRQPPAPQQPTPQSNPKQDD
jgi:hypothetical protein